MKRFILIIGMILLANMAFAITDTLIDFTQLEADYTPTGSAVKQNQATLIDFSAEAGSTFTQEEREKMVTSLAMDNWRVNLASSSATVERQAYSYTKEAKTHESALPFQDEPMAGKAVLGVRIKYPKSAFNSYAIVTPPFEIQAYQDQLIVGANNKLEKDPNKIGQADMFVGKGVLKNVGVLKEIEVMAYGANYPHALEIILQNENYEQKSYHVTYLDYEGWGKRKWTNPNYIDDVRNREITKYALYPRSVPYLKFIGFVIYRDAGSLGGDFITYFKDVKLTYDLAIKEIESPQIDDEAVWGILEERNAKRREAEYKRLGSRQVLELIEKEKMHIFTASTSDSAPSTATN